MTFFMYEMVIFCIIMGCASANNIAFFISVIGFSIITLITATIPWVMVFQFTIILLATCLGIFTRKITKEGQRASIKPVKKCK